MIIEDFRSVVSQILEKYLSLSFTFIYYKSNRSVYAGSIIVMIIREKKENVRK